MQQSVLEEQWNQGGLPPCPAAVLGPMWDHTTLPISCQPSSFHMKLLKWIFLYTSPLLSLLSVPNFHSCLWGAAGREHGPSGDSVTMKMNHSCASCHLLPSKMKGWDGSQKAMHQHWLSANSSALVCWFAFNAQTCNHFKWGKGKKIHIQPPSIHF